MKRTTTARAVVLAALLGSAGAADAQTTFTELQQRVKSGDVIFVTDHSGHVTRGIFETAGQSIRVSVAGTTREWLPEEVREVRRRGDSVSNGLGIGALSGAAAGTACGLALASLLRNEGHDPIGAFFGVFAASVGAGAGIGAGLDAAITGNTVVYQQPKRTTSIAPVISPSGGGVRIAFSF